MKPGTETPVPDGDLVVTGRAISPGLACGPVVRNHARLTASRARDSILVAERAVPDDVVRLRAAAGTLTLGGAVLSHVSLLSRELGKPSVALDPLEVSIPGRGRSVLRITGASVVPAGVAIARGDVMMLDGDRGVVRIPGAARRGSRRAVREAFEALRALEVSGDDRDLRRLDLSSEILARFVLEAGSLYGTVRPGDARRRLIAIVTERLGSARSRELRSATARRATSRLESWCRAAGASLAAAGDVDELDRVRRELSERIAASESLLDDLGQSAEGTPPPVRRLLESIRSRRDRLVEALDARIEETLRLGLEEQRARAGKIHQILRRARAVGLATPGVETLQRTLDRLRPPASDPSAGPLVLPLDGDPVDSSLVGGKAAGLFGLARLLPAGCRVPPGFVVTTAAYRSHLLGEAGDRLRHALQTQGNPRALSRLARAAIWSTPIPPEVSREIVDRLGTLPARHLAVRSSTSLEDGPAGSLAGLLETSLGIRGVDEVLTRIRRAWTSLWDVHVLDVLAVAGVSPLTGGVAVLVQRLIETRAAGVLFTRDPSGAPDTMVVNAAWGLGEGIRSGEIEGDLYRLQRGSGELLSFELGRATTQVVLDRRGPGTVEQAVPATRRRRRCLEDGDLSRLAELARSLDAATGRGQDVEFGFDRTGCLWVFQVRRAAGRRTG